MTRFVTVALPLAAAALLAACSSMGPTGERTARISRTAHGVAHISAPDAQTLAYGVAYAHAQDNVCQTANQLVTVRGERARFFEGGKASALLGRRVLPNEQIDLFIAAHMDDAVLEQQWSKTSAEAQALALGYVQGYNRFLTDQAGKLPAACNGQPWVRPMTLADFRRLAELSAVQAGIAALADAWLAAAPPAGTSAAPAVLNLADAAAALRDVGLLDSPLGSNAWAFGKDTTANGSGVLLGNPHFPWTGVNRFWQMHLTIPGQLDVMGAAIGHGAVVQVGFNKDVAWSHTVSTGKRFTLHELSLVPGDPTSYQVDGKALKMNARAITIAVRQADGTLRDKTHTVWSTRWGPVIVMPRAGLNWTTSTAYALKDANAGNARSTDTWLGLGRASRVGDMRTALANQGVPWVNTIAADRHGQVLFADVSVVPDIDAKMIELCAPSKPAQALRGAAGLIVLDGSNSICDWRRDASAPVPGLIPIARMPVAERTDWVHNSNDSFYYSNPAHNFGNISPMVGDTSVTRARTRAGLTEIPQLLAQGKVTPQAIQRQLFENRNFMASVIVPDLLAACARAPNPAAQDGCKALAGWNLRNELDARGAHLFREFWRTARTIPQVYRVPFNEEQPAATPAGLKMDDPAVAAKVWDALTSAVNQVRSAGFALDAELGTVQRPAITEEPIALHGGDEIEGVLNNLGRQEPSGINKSGLRIDYGTSYVQTVTFDAQGPVAQGLLTYGQSTNPASAHAYDQLRLYSRKEWPELPFRTADVERQRLGDVLLLTRP